MGDRRLLLLVLAAVLGARADESRVWIAMDIKTEAGCRRFSETAGFRL